MKKENIEKTITLTVGEKRNDKILEIVHDLIDNYEFDELLFFDEMFNFYLIQLYNIQGKSFFQELARHVNQRQESFKEFMKNEEN